MAMIKYKNDAGEWVSAAPANFMHQFKIIKIGPREDLKSYDLSAYIPKNGDFMIGFTCGPKTASTTHAYVWHRATEELYMNRGELHFLTGAVVTNPIELFLDSDTHALEAIEITYDEETRILTLLTEDDYTNRVGAACLIYAG